MLFQQNPPAHTNNPVLYCNQLALPHCGSMLSPSPYREVMLDHFPLEIHLQDFLVMLRTLVIHHW